MSHLTDDQYVQSQGLKCPSCSKRAVSIDGNADDSGVDVLLVPCSCGMCGSAWVEVYVLSGFDNLITKEEQE